MKYLLISFLISLIGCTFPGSNLSKANNYADSATVILEKATNVGVAESLPLIKQGLEYSKKAAIYMDLALQESIINKEMLMCDYEMLLGYISDLEKIIKDREAFLYKSSVKI